MPSPTRRAAQLALAADLRAAVELTLDSPDRYPHAARYVSAHGRLPHWADLWGDTRALTRGEGWAARLWAADVPLSAVRFHLPPATAHGLDALPGDRLPAVLRAIVAAPPHRPQLGAVCAEWSPGAAWHWHGILTAEDAAHLGAALEGAPHLGGLHAQPVSGGIRQFGRALAYMGKRVRQDAGPQHLVTHAERLLRFRAEAGGSYLPRLVTSYG